MQFEKHIIAPRLPWAPDSPNLPTPLKPNMFLSKASLNLFWGAVGSHSPRFPYSGHASEPSDLPYQNLSECDGHLAAFGSRVGQSSETEQKLPPAKHPSQTSVASPDNWGPNARGCGLPAGPVTHG